MPECNVRFKFSIGDTVCIVAAKRNAEVKALWVNVEGVNQYLCEWFTDTGTQNAVYFRDSELAAV